MRPIIHRYLFGQLMGPVLLAALALCVVALLTEALSFVGLMLNQRQSVWIFAEVVLLATPQMLVLVLPIALLLAGMIVLNRLHREHEIAVCFAAGVSRWNVISPALRLASLGALISLIVNLWIQPASFRAMRAILEHVKHDVAAALIRPGRFTHPAPGVTIYAQSIDESGAIHNLFIDRRLPSGRDTTITAAEGRLGGRDGAPLLLLRRGVNEDLAPDGTLSSLSFDTYGLDLRPLLPTAHPLRYKPSDRFLHELVFPDATDPREQAEKGVMIAEAHARLATPLYNIAFMFLSLTAVLGGAFSRLGYGLRMAAAAAVALTIRGFGFVAQGTGVAWPGLNVLQYASPITACAACAWILFGSRSRQARPADPARSPRASVAALVG